MAQAGRGAAPRRGCEEDAHGMTIELSSLDLRSALDFAILVEEDAQLRYEELARRAGDGAPGARDVFRAMVATESEHRSALVERRRALFRDAPPRIEISSVEGVERPDLEEDDDLPSTAREALEVALAAERRARAFYAGALPHLRDAAVRAFFERLLHEEEEHAAELERRLAETPAAPAAVPPAARGAPRPAPTFPDRERLAAALPCFDAATRAVAAAVLDGRDEGEVALALGVSRRTVSRRLAGFLAAARRGAAVALAAATLAGAAPARAEAGAAAPAAGAEDAGARPARVEPSLAARIHAKVARRMARHDPSLRERVARAIVAESQRAGVDPVLVLAVIHVESSFNPNAVSTAGAVGLMQLLGPTMRRELERSGLPAADPADPIANVQAGVRYLRRLLDAFAGDVDTALMAYNAGPNRIRGHQRSGGIPERFHVYPRKVRGEVERLRGILGLRGGPSPGSLASGEERPRPVS